MVPVVGSTLYIYTVSLELSLGFPQLFVIFICPSIRILNFIYFEKLELDSLKTNNFFPFDSIPSKTNFISKVCQSESISKIPALPVLKTIGPKLFSLILLILADNIPVIESTFT